MILCSPLASAQTNQGIWQTPFNHVVPPFWVHQSGKYNGKNKDGELESIYATAVNSTPRFMAAHMALIPTGTYRGQVLVWNMMRTPMPSYQAGYDTQYWSIMNSTTPPTFLNYALGVPPPPTGYTSQDIYCAGHSWNRRGELFVAGGNRWLKSQSTWKLSANSLAFTFDSSRLPPGNAMWRPETDISTPRWYPTVTTIATDSGSLPNSPKDFLMVSGGTRDGTVAKAFKTYEVFSPKLAAGSGGWENNPAASLPYPGFAKVFPGSTVLNQWQLYDYPRNIMLSSGQIFTAGMRDKSYRVKHDNVTVTNPPVWQVMALANQTIVREYGSVVLFPNLGGPNGGFQDLVLKMPGAYFGSVVVLSGRDGQILARADNRWRKNISSDFGARIVALTPPTPTGIPLFALVQPDLGRSRVIGSQGRISLCQDPAVRILVRF